MIRIALADDHQLVLDGLKALIKGVEDFEFVAEANDGKRLCDIVSAVKVDVVLVDIDMPVMNGMQAIQEIGKKHPEVKCIALTMHNEKGMIQRVFSAGAAGYMLKNIDQADLIAGIRKVHAGEKVFSSDAEKIWSGDKTGGRSETALDTSKFVLTEREIEILKWIANGLSNKEIGDKLFISHRTVDTHRTNLMKKLDVHNIAGLIRYAIRSGYVE